MCFIIVIGELLVCDKSFDVVEWKYVFLGF